MALKFKRNLRQYTKQKFPEAANEGALQKKVLSEILQKSQESTCARVSFLIKLPQACNFIKKETLAQVFEACNLIRKDPLVQVFSCEFLPIFYRTPSDDCVSFPQEGFKIMVNH